DDGHFRVAVLGDLGGVDVGVDDLGLGCEGVEAAGDTVVEAGPQGDDEVGLLQGADGGDVTVHPGHAHVQRVAVGEDAACHECGDHGDPREFGQDAEFARCPGAQDTTADVQDGAFGVGDHPGGFAHLFAVRFGHGPV